MNFSIGNSMTYRVEAEAWTAVIVANRRNHNDVECAIKEADLVVEAMQARCRKERHPEP